MPTRPGSSARRVRTRRPIPDQSNLYPPLNLSPQRPPTTMRTVRRTVSTELMDLLDRELAGGRIRVQSSGGARVVGRGGPEVGTFVVHDPRVFERVLTFGNLGLGEAFMDGDFTVEEGRLPEVLTLLARSRLDRTLSHDPRLVATALWMRLVHARMGRAHNVRSHYDIGNDLFEAILDPTLTYSCGYASSVDTDVASLQLRKLDRICDK